MPLLVSGLSTTQPRLFEPPRWSGQAQSGPSITPARGEGAYRNPYRAEYFGRFRPGYHTLLLGDAQYYWYDSLAPDCVPTVLNGVSCYLCDGIYYQPYFYGGQTVYLVMPY